jgi:queuine tRNA-ribosyltransferase
MMNWSRPILTDSGGFQVHSLATLRKINEDGIEFQSHIDGSRHELTPELSMRIQEALGADIVMCFDDCASYPTTDKRAHEAVDRTIAWARRCREAHSREDQALFGIIQGGVVSSARMRCTEEMLKMDFPGYALGGLSVGEPKDLLCAALDETAPNLPQDRPRYLMGVGTPEDFFEGVSRGIDLFDCVMPTRTARNALIFTSRGRVQARRAEFRESPDPPDPECSCYTCRHYSAGYLRHLFVAGEILAARLATLHNLHFFLNLMRQIREHIRAGSYSAFRSEFLSRYTERSDPGGPEGRPGKRNSNS